MFVRLYIGKYVKKLYMFVRLYICIVIYLLRKFNLYVIRLFWKLKNNMLEIIFNCDEYRY